MLSSSTAAVSASRWIEEIVGNFDLAFLTQPCSFPGHEWVKLSSSRNQAWKDEQVRYVRGVLKVITNTTDNSEHCPTLLEQQT
jgi:hypothetical protein